MRHESGNREPAGNGEDGTAKMTGQTRRCVVVGGADIGRYDRIRARLREDDFLICCDSGLRHREGLGREPELIVGYFDSHENPHLDVETIVLPREKDDTDTVFAMKEALRRGFSDFLLVGVIGGRLDHTLGNLSILLRLHSLGKNAAALDDRSELSIAAREPVFVSDAYAYFSLLSIDGTAEGVCVKNAKYPLEDAVITCEYPYGISNEVLPGQRAEISVGKGRLLLVKVWGE